MIRPSDLQRVAARVPLNWSEYCGWALLWFSVGYITSAASLPKVVCWVG